MLCDAFFYLARLGNGNGYMLLRNETSWPISHQGSLFKNLCERNVISSAQIDELATHLNDVSASLTCLQDGGSLA